MDACIGSLFMVLAYDKQEEKNQEGGIHPFSMSELLRPYQAMSNLIGTKYLPAFSFYHAGFASDEQVDQSAKEYMKLLLSPA